MELIQKPEAGSQTPEAGIRRFDDQYLSGAPVNQIVLGGGQPDVIPLVKWSLPNGARLTTTLLDYNRNFPFIFKHESKWRNAMNIRKRRNLGLDEQAALKEFESLRKKYFENAA